MNIVLPNWYGINLDKACEVLGDNVRYLGTFCVKGNYKPIAMFYCPKPNKSKGHKHYPGFFSQDGQLYVTGYEYAEIKQDLKQEALHCLECNDIIYSVNRHDYRQCSCGKVAIDGGKDYTKIAFSEDSRFKKGILNFKTGKFIESKK